MALSIFRNCVKIGANVSQRSVAFDGVLKNNVKTMVSGQIIKESRS